MLADTFSGIFFEDGDAIKVLNYITDKNSNTTVYDFL
jgi:hypothetical protein